MTEEAFVLVHSPVVGPRTWAATAEALAQRGHGVVVPALRLAPDAGPPYWEHLVDQVVEAVEAGPAIRAVTLVAHSAAGPLLPAIEDRLPNPVPCCLFVDATLPARAGPTRVIPARYLAPLRDLASAGRLPRWSQWWGDEAMASLVPDPALRAEIEQEMPSLPLAWFEEAVPVPPGWPASQCGYLQFSPPYEAEAAEARSRDWPVTKLPGGHLHMIVDPSAVANALLELTTARSS
ncbi:MAG TPA: alpha/beta fold hydrolase [Actinomycetota bacterium]